MISQVSVTLMTREPPSAASELDRDNVVGPMIMPTPRFRIHIHAADFDAVNFHALRERGQIRTSSDPMIQQAIIIAKPVLNEPVR